MAYYTQSRSPELKHPVPTHPAYIPEPPATPNSPQGYKRFASSPPPAQGMPPSMHAQSPPQQAPYGVPPPAFVQAQQQQPHPAFAASQGRAPAGQMGGPGFAVPQADFAAWGMNDATAQLGMQLGQSAVSAGQQYMQKNFGGFLPGFGALKHHFNVSNSYVIQKLRLIVFPWRHRPWTRKMLRSEQGASEWLPPREDINSPDLYIPVMALVTYILLAALYAGVNANFNPEILGVSASKALAVVIVDFLFVKLGCYFLNIQDAGQFIDLVAFGGYKFVGVSVTVIAGLLNFGRTVYTLVFLYAFSANAFFLLRSLRSVVLPDVNNTPAHVGTVNHAQRSRRITFLFLVAVLQVLYMGFLVRV